jgi:C4-dicarboxylate-specific signal transduction histidine kinase
MKWSLQFSVLVLTVSCAVNAQDRSREIFKGALAWKDTILSRLDTTRQDTTLVLATAELGNYYKLNKPDSALYYGYKALTRAREIKFPKGEVQALVPIIFVNTQLANLAKALQLAGEALKIADENNLSHERGALRLLLSDIYSQSEKRDEAWKTITEARDILIAQHDETFAAAAESFMAQLFFDAGQLDSAIRYCQIAFERAPSVSWVTQPILLRLGYIQLQRNDFDAAQEYFHRALSSPQELANLFHSYMALAQVHKQLAQQDSSTFYATQAFELARDGGFYSYAIDASVFLSSAFEEKDSKKALDYNKIALVYKDSLAHLSTITAFENVMEFEQQQQQREIEEARTEFQNRIKLNSTLGITFTLLVVAGLLFYNSRQKQKAKQKIEKAYDQLQATQSQLIQSEKMASLGELTAGIAHEIQNPLNFVNNFSEVNAELLRELQDAAAQGNLTEVQSLTKSIQENEDKVIHHGKRADGIVKSMMQHSRNNTGQKEPTDINALCDEYLRLAYHGFRAKDRAFNTRYETEFHQSLEKINVVPQEIGRVILNLLNNAFQAVAGVDNPKVIISTKKQENSVEIKIVDNGPGIPESIRDKIFQPFFTTRPTGQGTGLGLSLSYDIVKAHGGVIHFENKQEGGTEFVVSLPV